MKAYKIWHDTKYFIHKDTINDLNVIWTNNINDALDADNLYIGSGLPSYSKAVRFFFDLLGFNLYNRYDQLHLL
jgi:hypothetical protein